MKPKVYNPTELVAMIRPGDRVTILVPNGSCSGEWKEATGRAVICSGTHAALNMGGQYGTPGVATPDNIVRIGKLKVAAMKDLTQTDLNRPWKF